MQDTKHNSVATTTFASDARTPAHRGSVPVETLVAAAIRVQAVWDKIGALFTHERINGNPLTRKIAAFAGDFVQEHGKLPEGMDWQVWHERLDPQWRDGCWDVLQRLMGVTLPPTPEFLCKEVLEELRDYAGQLLIARIGEVRGRVSYETLERHLAEIKTLCQPAVPRSEMWLTLTTLEEQPELLMEPPEVVPRLVWRGRHTILAGLAKLGKSTIAAQAAAAVTQAAPFLDGKAAYGHAVWVGLDEHLGDTVRRLRYFGAWGKRIRLLALPPSGQDLLDSLERLLDEWPTDLVVLDSLIEWARHVSKDMPKDGDSAGWAQVVRPLTALAHAHDVGLLTLAHSRRADGRYRSSGEIAAATDVLYDMLGPGGRDKDSTLRRFEGVGRWEVGQWLTRMIDGAYVFVGEAGGVGVHNDDKLERVGQTILEVLGKAPDHTIVSKNELHRQTGGNPNICYKALALLEEQGQVQITSRGRALAIILAKNPPVVGQRQGDK